MPKQIFLFYSCDNWKSTDSMRLVCASTSPSKIKKAIIAKLNEEAMEYGDDDNLPVKKQVQRFKDDWKNKTRDDINNSLKYGLYDYVYDGDIN